MKVSNGQFIATLVAFDDEALILALNLPPIKVMSGTMFVFLGYPDPTQTYGIL